MVRAFGAPFRLPPVNSDVMSQKYARLEIERRWLVPGDVSALIDGLPSSEIEDRYLVGTRLRLRTVTSPDGSTQRKFCKKYAASPDKTFESITNLYLTDQEFQVLAALPAAVSRKRRHRLVQGSLDLYTQPAGVAIFEIEFTSESEARAFRAPSFVGIEVTGEEAYSGATLARSAT